MVTSFCLRVAGFLGISYALFIPKYEIKRGRRGFYNQLKILNYKKKENAAPKLLCFCWFVLKLFLINVN